MSARLSCPPAPGPLETYAVQFDSLLHTLAQRQGFRTYLTGLLLPRERLKTLTGLAGAEPLVQAQTAPVQRLQFFLSEATWDAASINAQRLALLRATPDMAPSAAGVLVIDDTGDRKEGHAIDHVARQYLGSVGKVDNGIVAVTSLWANEQHYYPLHVTPYTPAARLADGRQDAAFRTKPDIAVDLVDQALAAGIAFRAIVSDCFYGDNQAFESALLRRQCPYVLARRGNVSLGWARADVAHTFRQAAQAVANSAWHKVERTFRDGHVESWWVTELTGFGYGADQRVRALCATTDRRILPEISTWYLTTNLSKQQASLAEIVRLYGLRNWVEQSYKQMKNELGWADFMVRSDRAIRRHWTLVFCAFSFCWWHAAYRSRISDASTQPALPSPARKKNRPHHPRYPDVLAARPASGAGVARTGALAHTLPARVVRHTPAA